MIAVSADNYQQLRMLGHVPESFDTVIGRLIAEHNAAHAAGAAAQTK
jgi:hypothetical protein